MCSLTDPCGDCDYCARERLRDRAHRVADHIENENPELRRFVTLTLPGDGLQAGDEFSEQLPDFQAMIDELNKKIEDRKGSVEWVGSIEAQANGNPHAHLLVDEFIDQNWLANAWEECGNGDDRGGFVQIKYAQGDPAEVADYICGYAGGGIAVGNVGV